MKPLLSPLVLSRARRLLGALALGLTALAPSAFAQLYSENFDDGVANNWTVASGTWAVSSGTDKTYDSTSTGAGPEIAYYNAANYVTDYTYTAKVTRWGSGWNNQVGLVYYYKDANNYYRVGFGGTTDSNGKNIHLWQRVNGVETEVATGTFPTGTPSPMIVNIVRTGNQTQIKVAGTVYVTLNQTAITGTPARIGAFDVNAGGKFNDITITDHVPPTVAMSAPANGASVTGTVTVSATASDNVAVANVQFLLDGQPLQGPDSSPSYSIQWDTTPVSPGNHTLSARATDTSTNQTTSTSRTVTVANGLPGGWNASDIGSTGAAGSTNFSGGTWFVDGAGTNIWGTSDQFQFARQSISGDCTVIARANSVEAVATWSKAGIMIRDGTATNAKYVLLAMTPNNGLLFEARTGTGASSIQSAVMPTIDPPKWLKLVRSGDTFSASYSSDGTIWTTAGMVVSGTSQRQSTVNVTMPAAVQAGLAVCSTVNGNLCSATFDNVSVTANANFNPAFPRLGIYAIGGSYSNGQAYLPEARGVLAKFHVSIISGSGETWANGRAYTREDVVADIKAQSLIGTKVFQYVILESSEEGNPQLPTWHARAYTNNWWLWLLGTSGSQVEGPYGLGKPQNFWAINPTIYAPADSATGMRPFEWGASLVHDIFVNTGGTYGATGMAAPSLDGIFLDNVFPWTKADGDWNRNSAANDATDRGFHEYNDYSLTAASWWQNAHVTYYNKIRSLMPGKLQIGNTAEFGNISRPEFTDLNRIGALNQLLEGGLLEPAIGGGGAPESWNGPNYTENLRKYYSYTMNAAAPPKLVVFTHIMQLNGSDNVNATAYRAARYGLASCLMNDGYYDANSHNNITRLIADTRWFDEFSVYNGSGQLLTSANVNKGLGYLGRPLANAQGAVQTTARWAKGSFGVWAREFEGGIVLMNPRGNGQQTVTLTELGGSGVWKRILGTQDGAVNSGADVTGDVTLQDRDAIVLLRK